MKLVGLEDQLEKMNDIMHIAYKIKQFKIKLPKSVKLSILLHGEPGTGKTASVMQIAGENHMEVVPVKFSDIVSGILGDSLKRLDDVFKTAKEKSLRNPVILFFDEIDAIAKERSDPSDVGEMKRVVITFLQNIDAMDYEKNPIVLIGATNHAKDIDSAIWRRFMIKLEYKKIGNEGIREFLTSFAREYSSTSLIIDFKSHLDDLVNFFKDKSIAEIENSINTKLIHKLGGNDAVTVVSCADFLDIAEDDFSAKKREALEKHTKEVADAAEKKRNLEKLVGEIGAEITRMQKEFADLDAYRRGIMLLKDEIANLEESIQDRVKLLNIKKKEIDAMKANNKFNSDLINKKISALESDYKNKEDAIKPNLLKIEDKKKNLHNTEKKEQDILKLNDKIKELMKKKDEATNELHTL